MDISLYNLYYNRHKFIKHFENVCDDKQFISNIREISNYNPAEFYDFIADNINSIYNPFNRNIRMFFTDEFKYFNDVIRIKDNDYYFVAVDDNKAVILRDISEPFNTFNGYNVIVKVFRYLNKHYVILCNSEKNDYLIYNLETNRYVEITNCFFDKRVFDKGNNINRFMFFRRNDKEEYIGFDLIDFDTIIGKEFVIQGITNIRDYFYVSDYFLHINTDCGSCILDILDKKIFRQYECNTKIVKEEKTFSVFDYNNDLIEIVDYDINKQSEKRCYGEDMVASNIRDFYNVEVANIRFNTKIGDNIFVYDVDINNKQYYVFNFKDKHFYMFDNIRYINEKYCIVLNTNNRYDVFSFDEEKIISEASESYK